MPVNSPNVEEPVYGGGVMGATQQQAAAAAAPQVSATQNQPLPAGAGFVPKKGAVAYVANSIIDGWLKGRQVKAAQEMQRAQNKLGSLKNIYDDQAQRYKAAVFQAQTAGAGSPEAAAAQKEAAQARQDAVMAWDQYNQARAGYMIPEHEQKKGKGGKEKGGGFGQAMGGWASQVFGKGGVTPQLFAQAAVQAANGHPVGLDPSPQELEQIQHYKSEKLNNEVAQAELPGVVAQSQDRVRDSKQKELQQRVEELGGVDKVRSDPTASPALRQAADGMYFSKLDTETPEGKLRMQLITDIGSGKSTKWTPEQTMQAAALGLVPKPREETITLKNGHQASVLVGQDNKPVPGSVPLDLGPPQWAQEYYAKRAADRQDIAKAVRTDPVAYDVVLTGDKTKDTAAIEARVNQLQIASEFNIRTTADMLKTTALSAQNRALSTVDQYQLSTALRAVENLQPGDAKGPYREFLSNLFVLPNQNDSGPTAGLYDFRPAPYKPVNGKFAGNLNAEQFKAMAAKTKDVLATQLANPARKISPLEQQLILDKFQARVDEALGPQAQAPPASTWGMGLFGATPMGALGARSSLNDEQSAGPTATQMTAPPQSGDSGFDWNSAPVAQP